MSCYTNKKYRYTKESNSEACKRYIQTHPWMKHLREARTRCYNPKCKDYPKYGGRGIKVLLTASEIKDLWFRDGAESMKKPSIDRKKSTENYTYANCQFLEMTEHSHKTWRDRREKRTSK